MKNYLISFVALAFSTQLFAQASGSFLRVEPGSIKGFDKYPSEKNRIENSFPIIEAVINSQEFKERVVSYVGSNRKREYASNKGLTNEMIYEKLMEGKELLNGTNTPFEMNLDIQRYLSGNPWSKVIAYTTPGKSPYIFVNGRKYKNISTTGIAGNLTHEWIHLMGFYHDSAKDQDSVPYAIGSIMGQLAKKYVEQGYLD